MNKVNLVIFSKDRACQLDLLLRSIATLGWSNEIQPYVIWKASSAEYSSAYSRCFSEWSYAISCPQFNDFFREQTLSLLSELRGYTAFSTDDMVFYQTSPGDLLEILDTSFKPDSVFSLRLGLNTIIQDYHLQSKQPILNQYADKNSYIIWPPLKYHPHSNYGYPLAVDCHIFDNKKILEISSRFGWRTTNDLESGWQRYRNEIGSMIAYKNSVAVNIPVNTLSGITKAGEQFPYSLELLNEQYLEGKRISLSSILDKNIVGCHQEMELKLI